MADTSMSLKATIRRSANRRCLDLFAVDAVDAVSCWQLIGMPFEWGAELMDIAIVGFVLM